MEVGVRGPDHTTRRQVLGLAASALALVAAAPPLAREPASPPSLPPPPEVVAWVARNAIAVSGEGEPVGDEEAATIARIVGDASVIGFGEVGHGNREPLDYRNRLIRHLVEHHELTAVALESGLAGGRRVDEYVRGGPGDPEAIVRANLGWGFGRIIANAELARWLRGWNDAHPKRKVGVYGTDLSVMLTPKADLVADLVLADVVDFLARMVPARSADVRAALQPFQGRFGTVGHAAMDTAERARLQRALDDATAMFASERTAMIRGSSPEAYAFAAREAHDARALPAFFPTWTVQLDIDKIEESIRLRDRAMADHLLWALELEGPRGRILVFAANGHIGTAPMIGSVLRVFARQPATMGVIARARLGGDYRAILSTSARGRTANDATIGSVDRAFAAADRPRALLDLRAAPGWWSRPQTLAQGDARLDDTVPAHAAAGLVHFERLTPAPATP